MDCPSTPGAPWFPFTLIQASQTSCLLSWNGLPDAFSSSTQLLPEHFWLTERTTATDDPAPSLRPHYRGFITTTGRSASAPRRRYSCPYGALPARALPLTPGHRLASRRAPARLLPEHTPSPRF